MSTNLAYVLCQTDNTVSVIDTATHKELKRIFVGNSPGSIAITPDGNFGYVTIDAGVSVFDTCTDEVVCTISISPRPGDIAITPDGKFAYAVSGPVAATGTVSVIDTATNAVVLPNISVGNDPRAIAITPDGKFAYVLNRGDTSVTVIDTDTKAVVTIPNVGDFPVDLAINPDGRFAYVTCNGPHQVSVIETTPPYNVSPLGTGSMPIAIAISPDGNFGYVTTDNPPVLVFDAFNNVGTNDQFILSGTAIGIDITPDGKFAYVSLPGFIEVYDTVTRARVSTILVEDCNGSVVFGPACNKYTYPVKFVCGTQSDRGHRHHCNPVLPGVYATEINIFNPTCREAKIRKRLVPVVLADEATGREPEVAKPRATDHIVLPSGTATMDDCCRIGELLYGHTPSQPMPLAIGFMEIISDQELQVTAVYTASDLKGNGLSLDVETVASKRK